MSFYSDPSFFVILLAASIPAAILGCHEKTLKYYGFGASVVLILLLFSKSWTTFAAFVFYVALSFAVSRLFFKECTRPEGRRRGAYPLAIVLEIAPLVIYKISAVFDENILGFIGISYITFKAVQVIIETEGHLIKEYKPFDYLYFLIFFAPFTSGPIMRSRDFAKDIAAPMPHDDYVELLGRGMVWFAVGAFYKMVCSSLFSIALWAVPKALGTTSPVMAALGQIGEAYAYGFYLFFDFAGYSLMAMGAGAAFGIHVPRNFRAPFISIDIKDFWNRWHITLSYWLRDFVFMRFVRVIRRKKLIDSRLTTMCCGYIVNMGLMGCWHGLTASYIAYGLFHGLLLAGNELFDHTKFYKRNKDKKPFKVCEWFVTFNLIMFGFALFSGQVPLG